MILVVNMFMNVGPLRFWWIDESEGSTENHYTEFTWNAKNFQFGLNSYSKLYLLCELWPKAYCFQCRILILTYKSTAITRISNIGGYSFDSKDY